MGMQWQKKINKDNLDNVKGGKAPSKCHRYHQERIQQAMSLQK